MTIGFQCLTTIRYGEQGIGWACADPGGEGGGGGGQGVWTLSENHTLYIWVDLDLNPLPHLTKFPGSAHGGFISLECIRTDCLMEDQAQGVTLYQLGAWDWLKIIAFTWLR